MAEKILITGASGFVGSWLVQEALSRELETYAGIRSTSSTSLLNDPNIRLFEMDFTDETGLRSLMEKEKFDYVIHNAGITRAAKDETYFTVNSDYAVRLANAWMAGGGSLKKYVYISSVEAYGSADDTSEGIVREDTEPNPRTMYGQSKIHAERALKNIEGLPLLIMRPTAVFGPGEKDFFALFKTINRFGFSPTIGTKDIRYSFIYVKDLVRIILKATLSQKVNSSYFITDGRLYSFERFTNGIAAGLGKKTWGFTIPFALLDGVVAITGVLDRVTGKKSLLNKEQMAKAKARNWDYDIGNLVRDFQFSSKFTMEQATKETADWYKEQGWL